MGLHCAESLKRIHFSLSATDFVPPFEKSETHSLHMLLEPRLYFFQSGDSEVLEQDGRNSCSSLDVFEVERHHNLLVVCLLASISFSKLKQKKGTSSGSSSSPSMS